MRVYVAGPIAIGHPGHNIRQAIDAAEQLRAAGHVPFVPHLCTTWDVVYPTDAQDWLDWCFEWLRQCEAMVRLPGESRGSDLEVVEAGRIEIPVFYSVNSFLAWSSR